MKNQIGLATLPWWELIRRRLMAVFASYRPELHCMRGRGPKWREKHARAPADGTIAIVGTIRSRNHVILLPRKTRVSAISYCANARSARTAS